jgi:hypothetical protein
MTSQKRRHRTRPRRLDTLPVKITNEEILADLLYPARSLWAAQPGSRGRKQATVEARLTAVDSGKLLAHASSTCLILDG